MIPFRQQLAQLINAYNVKNGSDTPDYVLAEFLTDVLAAFDKAVSTRERWYGRRVENPVPSPANTPDPAADIPEYSAPYCPIHASEWQQLTRGDILTHKGTGEAWVVDANWGDGRIGLVRTLLASNPPEWYRYQKDDPVSRLDDQDTAGMAKLHAMIHRLRGMMATTRRENSQEWMEHLVGMLNQACADIGDESQFAYDERQGTIVKVRTEGSPRS